MVLESIGYGPATIVDCENINTWFVLFKQFLIPNQGLNEVLEIQIPENKSVPGRQLRREKLSH